MCTIVFLSEKERLGYEAELLHLIKLFLYMYMYVYTCRSQHVCSAICIPSTCTQLSTGVSITTIGLTEMFKSKL